jgi:hypothetical protein
MMGLVALHHLVLPRASPPVPVSFTHTCAAVPPDCVRVSGMAKWETPRLGAGEGRLRYGDGWSGCAH